MSTTLLSFPAEVFANLSEFLPYADLEKLWNTNTLRLQKILGNTRGIRAIDFEFAGQEKAWPLLVHKTTTLSSLTVTSVVISPSPVASRLHPTYATLNTLPKSLTRLALRFPLAEQCLRVSSQGDRKLPRYTPAPTSEAEEFINLADVLPQLSTLELEGNEDLGDKWLGTLPPSLTSLAVSKNSKFTDEGLLLLPEHLESLRLPMAIHITGTGLDRLKGLLALALHGRAFKADDEQIDNAAEAARFTSHLPKSLTELELACNKNIEAVHLTHLPSSLTKLNLASNPNITNFAALPTSLVFLAIATPVTAELLPSLPQGLKTLVLLNGRQLDNESIAALPRTLNSLAIWHATQLNDEALPLLPQGLTSITLDAKGLSDAAAVYFSSPQLRTIRLLSCPLTDAFIDTINVPYLTRLDVTGARDLTNQCVAKLPRSLRHLNMVTATRITPDCLPDLPQGLIHWTLMSSDGFEETPKESFPKSLRTFFAADRTMLPE